MDLVAERGTAHRMVRVRHDVESSARTVNRRHEAMTRDTPSETGTVLIIRKRLPSVKETGRYPTR